MDKYKKRRRGMIANDTTLHVVMFILIDIYVCIFNWLFFFCSMLVEEPFQQLSGANLSNIALFSKSQYNFPHCEKYYIVKATVVYRRSKVMNRLKENNPAELKPRETHQL